MTKRNPQTNRNKRVNNNVIIGRNIILSLRGRGERGGVVFIEFGLKECCVRR